MQLVIAALFIMIINNKHVLIKWTCCYPYDDRGLPQSKIRNAHRTIRQQIKLQLKDIADNYCYDEYLLSEIFPEIDRSWDTFTQPFVSCDYFD